MPVHVKRIDGLAHYEIRLFGPGKQYGDGYDASLNVTVHDEYIEVTMMQGKLSHPLRQLKELRIEFAELKKRYRLPMLAERKHGVFPFAVHLCSDWWEIE